MPDSVTLFCSEFSPGMEENLINWSKDKLSDLWLSYCTICVEMSEGSWKLPLTNLFSFCFNYPAWSLRKAKDLTKTKEGKEEPNEEGPRN